MTFIPIIICGGAGSRLWPVSRATHPKPFIRLGDGQSLLQKAFLRGAALPDVAEVLTITGRDFFFKTEDELREVNANGLFTSFILEPMGRNTAAAIAAAALRVAEKDPKAIMLILPADHLIENQAAFADAVKKARALAENGKIVTFGIRPHAPETGYGYVETRGESVVRFVEKPDAKTAQAYLESGNFLWNAGMFCFKAQTVLDDMAALCPDILDAVRISVTKGRKTEGAESSVCELDSASFAVVRDMSFDYAIMEKSSRVAVVPCEAGWSDVGSWNTLGALLSMDNDGNQLEGETILHDVSNCHIQSGARLVGAVGIRDLVIIDTPDALLVADKSRTQDVKHLYGQLKKKDHTAHKLHNTVHRPWGTYTVLEEGAGYKIKRIVVKSGAVLSLQLHRQRSEHWVVVAGTAKVTMGVTAESLIEHVVTTNESVYVQSSHLHRVMNPETTDLVMIEVQTGAYLGEDDIVRLEDKYGRA